MFKRINIAKPFSSMFNFVSHDNSEWAQKKVKQMLI